MRRKRRAFPDSGISKFVERLYEEIGEW
jgi:hypothetical protein